MTYTYLNDSPCYSNQQQPSPSLFICSACIASSIPFFNLANTEFYNLLLFDNSDLSNFLKSFACDLSPQHYQTKYSTLSDTGKMNHANKPENLSFFHFNVRSRAVESKVPSSDSDSWEFRLSDSDSNSDSDSGPTPTFSCISYLK